jgi:hypothetical protein
LISGLADQAWFGFIAALALLLAASILVVIRQPPWVPPPPADETGGPPRGPAPAERWPAYPAPSYGRHSAGPTAGPTAGLPARPRPAPLPVRQPVQSGWPQPAGPGNLVGQESLAGPNGEPPPVTGGPPWGPAPRPPGMLP